MTVSEGLASLVESYAAEQQEEVRFRVPSWKRALGDLPGDVTALLRSNFTSEPESERSRKREDRLVTREEVANAASQLELEGPGEVILRTFVLVMAWGSGTSNPRSLRYTRQALSDPDKAANMLRASAGALRAVTDLDEQELRRIYASWHLPGVGPSFFTKWFAFAGAVPERSWQPLILDQRVARTLNRTLDVLLRDLTPVRGPGARYAAYVRSMHEWANELAVPAERLEWIFFAQNGEDLPIST